MCSMILLKYCVNHFKNVEMDYLYMFKSLSNFSFSSYKQTSYV